MRYRKKPIEVEAVRLTAWDGLGNRTAERCSLVTWLNNCGADFIDGFLDGKLLLRTLEGDMQASVGDWIIRGIAGEFYPCKPDIFEATYEPVEEG